MIRVVIGAAEQAVAFDLRSALAEIEGVETVFVVDSTADLAATVLRMDPDILLVHDVMGPDPVMPILRDIGLRRPATSMLVVSSGADPLTFSAAFEAGAKGVVTYPLTFEDLRGRVEAAGEYSANLRRMLAASGESDAAAAGRGRIVAVVGAKGGVGTTTIATHLALDVVRADGAGSVLLVDLDLEKGDIPGIIEIRHRASVADVAKVADDLSGRAVTDAVVAHPSGLHLLLAPTDVRDVEAVTPQALREIMAVVRQQYDVVVVDGGAHVTPAQAALVELADEVVGVVTPDVAALRGLRRAISQWEGLGVRKEADVRVLLNRLSRNTSVSVETVRQLTRAPVLNVGLPAAFRRLEPALNARDPQEMREPAWWQAIARLRTELDVGRAQAAALGRGGRRGPGGPQRMSPAGDPEVPAAGRRRKRRGKVRAGDEGSIAIEFVAVFPLVALTIIAAWQMAVFGLSTIWVGHAASVAARAESIGKNPLDAARDRVPAAVADDLTVSTVNNQVTVTLSVPLLVPGLGSLPATVRDTREVVREP